MHSRFYLGLAGIAVLGLVGLSILGSRLAGAASPRGGQVVPAPAPVPSDSQRIATFAGGCFWSMQKAFDGVPGVISTTAGFAGGTKAKPSYEQVSDGGTGHAESVQLIYDPAKISYERLLDIYWHRIDPLTLN